MQTKIAIKREQSQARLSYAEREQFGATLKFIYSLAATFITAAVTLGSLTACSNEDMVANTQKTIVKEAPVCYFNIPASFANGAESRAVTIGESTATTTFENTDKVYVVIEHNGTYAIGYEGSGSEYLSMTVTPDADPATATLSGALKFYYDFKSTPTAFTPAVDDVVYLLYNMTNPFYLVSLSSFEYDFQNGSKDQVTSVGGIDYYGASYRDYAQAKMKITDVSGSTDVGFTMSLVQYDDPTKSNVSFQNLGSIFRQRLSFTDKNGNPVTPTLTKFTISTANNKVITGYFPFSSDPAHYSLFSIENPVIDGNGDIYFALMFNDDNKDEALILTAEDEDGNVYTCTKAAPGSGFARGKYYHGSATLAWQNHRVDLSTKSGDYTAQDGDILTGTLASNYNLYIEAGATVTLAGMTHHAGDYINSIECLGTANIILAEGTTNDLTRGSSDAYAGLFLNNGTTWSTLTISGTGTLLASGGFACAGIGGINYCNDIVINGGIIYATGGQFAPGIGAGANVGQTGNITINGGNITATGGEGAAGIGAGCNSSYCKDITIENTVTSVTAIKGKNASESIGRGSGGNSCGTVKFGTATMFDDSRWTTPTNGENYGGLHFVISTTTNTNDTWTLTPTNPNP